ncbi:MAG: 30S ribosomal protein S8 [Candidatus Omnitrophica bacterium]|nr:30S ribosomal protein S8 [Candidatus Omnitrophota bacterium]MBU4477501.1 30S ribosomal protein S8 [Candidatus Omnitrophota bacterium]MCG2702899.1 30S ribosomal protein S8 [Candidatus Omnitrophota bacterium]
MSITDPIADMLTVIRNAQAVKKEKVDFPSSKLKVEILKLVKAHGYIVDYRRIEDGKQGILRVYLRYAKNKDGVITGLKRISTPGCRRYVDKEKIPRVLGGMGMAIMSTPKGILSDKEARHQKLGGEVLCYIW